MKFKPICQLILLSSILLGGMLTPIMQIVAQPAKESGGKLAKSNDPVFIRSDKLELDSKSKIFTYRENVEVTKGDLVITADTVRGEYNDNNEIQKIYCEDNVVITRGERLRANSNRAVYDVVKGTIVLTEAPEVNDQGNVLSADKVTIYVQEDRSEAEGHVRVKVLKSTNVTEPTLLNKRTENGKPASSK